MPVLESVGIAVPGEPVPQSALRAKAEEVLAGLAPELIPKLAVFETTGIATRHFVRPIDWYLASHGWSERAAVFAEEGLALAEAAARDALARADLPAHAVDAVVLVSTTGIATPSLDARLVGRLGLRPDVQRVPVFGLGCAGGVAGLRLAASLAKGRPDARILFVAVETCSLAFDLGDMDLRAFVATTLFADGAAAALVRGDALEGPSLGRLRAGASHLWPGTERVMGWDVEDEGLRVVFDRAIPSIVERDLAPVLHAHLKAAGCERPDRLLFHPGGAKVLDAYARGLQESPARFATAASTLRRYGNMSSPTVLFVARASLDERPLARGETALLSALGPGFAAELLLLEG